MELTTTAYATAQRPAATLTFRPITADAIPRIAPFLAQAPVPICDYNVGNLLIWQPWYRYQYAIAQSTLFIKALSLTTPPQTAFLPPVGALPLSASLPMLQRYCHSRSIPLLLTAVPEPVIPYILAAAPGTIPEPLPDWADYLYDIHTLATFTGHAMNKKRNHLNRFQALYPQAVLQPLTPALIPEAVSFLHTLANSDATPSIDPCRDARPERPPKTPETTPCRDARPERPLITPELHADPFADHTDIDTIAEMGAFEAQQTIDTIRNWGNLPLFGAVLRTAPDGPIVALTAAEAIGDTLHTHIEKIDHTVPGAGPAITCLFARHALALHPGLHYSNRQEDCGDPGLRHAKQSLHPLTLLPKYNLGF